jgi:uncharacterized protein (DUF2384 family)
MSFKRPPRRYAGERPLDSEETRRRGDVVRIASELHPTSAEALAFLNQHHEGLGGRPLDLATASEAGLAAVTAALGESPAKL